jgi:hypothetical protein
VKYFDWDDAKNAKIGAERGHQVRGHRLHIGRGSKMAAFGFVLTSYPARITVTLRDQGKDITRGPLPLGVAELSVKRLLGEIRLR